MTHAYAVLIKDEDAPDMGAVVIKTEYELDFDQIKRFIEEIVDQPSMRGKFDLSMADSETTYDVIAIGGVILGRFTFHNTERHDWAVDGAKSLVGADPRYEVTVTAPEALALAVLHTGNIAGLGDVVGPLRGIPYMEL
jgi:hypothetical protein